MGVNSGVLNTAINGKIVWCSFKSFEQCMPVEIVSIFSSY